MHNLFNLVKMFLQGEKSGLRLKNSMEYVTGTSPYQLPVINNYVIPVPPPPLQKGDKSITAVRNGVHRGRRYHPTTAPNDVEQLLTKVSYLCVLLCLCIGMLPSSLVYLPNAERCVYLVYIKIY